jgi:hypothetical protein
MTGFRKPGNQSNHIDGHVDMAGREVKLHGHRPGLPGKVVSFHIVPLDPAYPAWGGTGLAGHVPATWSELFGEIDNNLNEFSERGRSSGGWSFPVSGWVKGNPPKDPRR